jgi:hypothetical protein
MLKPRGKEAMQAIPRITQSEFSEYRNRRSSTERHTVGSWTVPEATYCRNVELVPRNTQSEFRKMQRRDLEGRGSSTEIT